jgi:chemotaxis protein histidine kinase CheA
MALKTMKDLLQALHDALTDVNPTDLESLAKAHGRFSEIAYWARSAQYMDIERGAIAAVRGLERLILGRDPTPDEKLAAITASLLTMKACIDRQGRLDGDTYPEALGLRAYEFGEAEEAQGPTAEYEGQAIIDAISQCRDDLASAELHILTLESDPTNAEAFEALFALTSRIAALGDSAGLYDISLMAHSLNGLLNSLESQDSDLEGSAAEAAFDALETLKGLVKDAEEGTASGKAIGRDGRIAEKAAHIQSVAHGVGPDGADSSLVSAAAHKRLGELLVDFGVATQAGIEEALQTQQESQAQRRMGQMLVEQGKITRRQLEEAIALQDEDPDIGKLGDILIEMEAITREDVEAAIESQQDIGKPKLGEVLVRNGQAKAKDVGRVIHGQGIFRNFLRMGMTAISRLTSATGGEDDQDGSSLGKDPELLKEFNTRVREQLEAAEIDLLNLVSEPDDKDSLASLIRAFHDMKRVAGFLSLHDFCACSHEIEHLLKQTRRRELDLEGPVFEAGFNAIAILKRLSANIERAIENNEAIADDDALADELRIIKAVAEGDRSAIKTDHLDPSAVLNRRLGELLIEAGITTEDGIEEALQAQAGTPAQRKLGEILIERALITAEQLEEAVRIQSEGSTGKRLGDILVDIGALDGDALSRALGTQKTASKPKLGEMLVRSGQASSKDVSHVLRTQNFLQDLIDFGVTAIEKKGADGSSSDDDQSALDPTLVDDFAARAQKHLDGADVNLLRLEDDACDIEAMNEARRAIRGMKRVSGYMGLDMLHACAFEFEKVLDGTIEGRLQIEGALLDLCFDTVDALNRRAGTIQQSVRAGKSVPPDIIIEALTEQLKSVAAGNIEVLDREPLAPTDFAPKKLGELLVDSGIITQDKLADALREQAAEPESKKLGEVLLEEVRLSPLQLEAALAKQQQDPTKKLGDVLVEMGLVHPEDLKAALERQRHPRKARLGEILVRRGYVPAKTIAHAIRSQHLVSNLVRAGATAAVIGVAIATPYTAAHADTAGSSSGGSVVVNVVSGPDLDTDMDGLSDIVEATLGTDANSADSDQDGMGDAWEVTSGLEPTNPNDAGTDYDGDGLTNLEEFNAGSQPYEQDTDQDGYWDNIEVDSGADPNSADSQPTPSQAEDVNADFVVDAVDLQIVQNAALGIDVPVPANVDNVGEVNALDIQLVVKAIQG